MYIDQITYTPADMEAERYLIAVRKANYGSVTSQVAEAAEGDTVTLNIAPKDGYRLKELRVVNGVYYTMGKTFSLASYDAENSTLTFVMPDDQVVLQPVFGSIKEMESLYSLDFTSTTDGTLPPGWRCVQENGEVHEYPNSYTLGARTFAGFTGYQGKALYWRTDCAEYGRQSAYPLALAAGNYKLSFATAAWKESPQYVVKVLDANDAVVAESTTYTATPNANGSKSANVTAAQKGELDFTVTQAGNYIIRFEDVSTFDGYHEFLLLDCVVSSVKTPTGINIVSADGTHSTTIYGIGGEQRQTLQRGLNIIRTADGKTRKVMVK